MKLFQLNIYFWFVLISCGQKKIGQPNFVINSKFVNDSFQIYITQPKTIDTNKSYSIFYYLDAEIKSGNKLRQLLQSSEFENIKSQTIFVGIGHIGNFHELRRRDFIPTDYSSSDTNIVRKNYGQAEKFYSFLKRELIPKINSTYKSDTSNNSILGHSFGGLFTFFCLFKNEKLFKNYYALSPSLWVNNQTIYGFDKNLHSDTTKKYLFFSTGSKEIINRIKGGTDKMNGYLIQKKYPNLEIKYLVENGEGHNSQVEKSLLEILNRK